HLGDAADVLLPRCAAHVAHFTDLTRGRDPAPEVPVAHGEMVLPFDSPVPSEWEVPHAPRSRPIGRLARSRRRVRWHRGHSIAITYDRGLGRRDRDADTVPVPSRRVVAQLAGVYPFVLEVAAKITSIADLKGKKIGVSSVGSSSDIATRAALKKLGLDPDKDVTIVPVGSAAQRTAAMLSGAIDAGVS